MRRIQPGEIEVGATLRFDCYDASGTLLLKKGLVIASEHQFEALLKRGLYQAPEDVERRQCLEPERKSPFHMLDAFRSRLAGIFAAFAKPEGADVLGRIRSLCADIQALCRYDADAALGALHLDHEGRYTIIHPLYVAILCELIAQSKAMAQAERISLLAAALTENVSIIDLQETLQRQATPLTPEQQQAMRVHPLESVDMLLAAGVGDDLWIKTVLHHHEKLDGSGYPGAMRGEHIPLTVRILSLADTYSAMVTPPRLPGHYPRQGGPARHLPQTRQRDGCRTGAGFHPRAVRLSARGLRQTAQWRNRDRGPARQGIDRPHGEERPRTPWGPAAAPAGAGLQQPGLRGA